MSGLERSYAVCAAAAADHCMYDKAAARPKRKAAAAPSKPLSRPSRAHSPAFTYLPPALYGLGVATHRRTHSGYKPAKNKLTCCDFTSFYHMQVSTNSH